MVDWKFIGGITALGGLIGFFGAKTIDTKKLPAGEKAVLTGASTGATMEGLETLMAAESFAAEKEKRSKYMEFIYDMFYTPGSDAYKIREERNCGKTRTGTYQLASQVGNAFDKRQKPFDSVLHNNLKRLSMGGGNTFMYVIPYKGELFVFSYTVKGRGRYKRGYHTYYPPDSQFGEEAICRIETKHGDDCYCYRKNYKAESHDFSQKSAESFAADGIRKGRYGYILDLEVMEENSWDDLREIIEKYTSNWRESGVGWGDYSVYVMDSSEEKLKELKEEIESSFGDIRFGAESLKKDSCCCGATKSNPCACMIQGVMKCSATCPCSLEN